MQSIDCRDNLDFGYMQAESIYHERICAGGSLKDSESLKTPL